MGENKEIETQYDLNAKWDACLDMGVRRFVYSSAAGAFAGLLLFHNRCVLLEYVNV
ncbi:putative MICOS complex subunit Mic10 protein [Helianthus annuus]|nr:putative MICOS complex subunit Mic10 protein [Helianthus annuus]